jgi:hypothetical protein
MDVERGFAFLKNTPPNDEHLFIVITKPDENDRVLCVNMDSYELAEAEYIDDSCKLLPGCHKFVTKLTYINYAKAILLSTDEIKEILTNGLFKQYDPVNFGILRQIQRGAKITDALPKKFKPYLSLLYDKSTS